MYDLERYKPTIAEFYIKVLHTYNKPELLRQFIEHWINILSTFVIKENFVTFEPTVPILKDLVPNARAVLVQTFPNKVVYGNPHISVIALFPFRVRYKHTTRCCSEGFEMLRFYLEITGIKIVGFHKVQNYDKLSEQLRQCIPNLQIYGPRSISSFFKIARLTK